MANKKKKTKQVKASKKPSKKITKKTVKKAVKKTKAAPKTKKAVVQTKAKAKLKVKTKAKAQNKIQKKTENKVQKTAKVSAPKLKKTIETQKAPVIDYSKAVTPLGDRLIVRTLSAERVTAGGLIIPQSAGMGSGYLKGTVLAAGRGNKNKKGLLKPLDVQVGDQILFSEYVGTKIQFNSEELIILNESDVMGIVQN